MTTASYCVGQMHIQVASRTSPKSRVRTHFVLNRVYSSNQSEFPLFFPSTFPIVLRNLSVPIVRINYMITFRKLQALMGREFIYVPGEESNSFHRALTRLRIAKIIQVSDGAVEVVKREEFQMYRSLILVISTSVCIFRTWIEMLLSL